MIGTADQDAFITASKYATVVSLRADGSPTSSVIFYARDGDRLLFSTTLGRLKAQTIARDPRVVLTVLDEGAPYRYVSVEGTATIESDDIIPGHVAVNRAMRGPGFEPPDGFEERLRGEGRVIITVTPTRVSGVVNRG